MTQLDLLGIESPFDAIKREDEGGEYWTGRDLMPLMDYGRWHEFVAVIEKAMASLAVVQGSSQVPHHFAIQHSDGGRWGNQSLDDYRLTRFGAYLTAMAGDDLKEAVAKARVYFAVRAREAEVSAEVRIPGPRRELTNRELALMVIEEADRADRAEAIAAQRGKQLAIAAPKADAWEVLASAEGDMSVREAAFVLNRDPNISTGQNRLFAKLQELSWIDKRKVPYASHDKHVRLRVYTYDDPVTREPVTRQQVRVTAEGLRLLHKRLGGTSPLSHLMPVDPPAA